MIRYNLQLFGGRGQSKGNRNAGAGGTTKVSDPEREQNLAVLKTLLPKSENVVDFVITKSEVFYALVKPRNKDYAVRMVSKDGETYNKKLFEYKGSNKKEAVQKYKRIATILAES